MLLKIFKRLVVFKEIATIHMYIRRNNMYISFEQTIQFIIMLTAVASLFYQIGKRK